MPILACSAKQGAYKHGAQRPEDIRQQRDIFWPVEPLRAASFKISLGTAQHFLAQGFCVESAVSQIQ